MQHTHQLTRHWRCLSNICTQLLLNGCFPVTTGGNRLRRRAAHCKQGRHAGSSHMPHRVPKHPLALRGGCSRGRVERHHQRTAGSSDCSTAQLVPGMEHDNAVEARVEPAPTRRIVDRSRWSCTRAGDVIRRVHVSRSREQQATAPRGSW